MKKLLIMIIVGLFLFSGCYSNTNKENDTTKTKSNKSNKSITTYTNKKSHTQKANNTTNTAQNKETLSFEELSSSDGILEPMSAEELITKLAYLNETSTMTDIINVFGKPPKEDTSYSCLGVWNYFSGDITISLHISSPYDSPLHDVILNYKDYSITIDLEETPLLRQKHP